MSIINIREYRKEDAESVGILIADTYGELNLSFLPPEDRGPYLGPFRHAHSPDAAHQDDIANILEAEIMLVAENEQGEIVGVLRGRKDRLHSLFVREDYHRMGIGGMLLERFEQLCIQMGGEVVRLAATFYAVPFYERQGYRKSTGVRAGWSFEGPDFKWQPMKKKLAPEKARRKKTAS